MKSISELYNEAISNDELRKKFLEAYSGGKIEEFLKENECEATEEEVKVFLEQEYSSSSGKLSDEELAIVVGGKGDDDNYPKVGQRIQYRLNGAIYTGRINHRGKNLKGRIFYEVRRDSSIYWERADTVFLEDILNVIG